MTTDPNHDPEQPQSPFVPGSPYAAPGGPEPQDQIPYGYGGGQYSAGQYGGATGQYPAAPPPPAGYGYGQVPYGYPAGSTPAGMPPLAGWWERVWAWLLDNFVVGAVFGIIAGITGSRAIEFIGSAAAIVWSVYNAVVAGKTGQSFGKRVAGIRLARFSDGRPVGGGLGFLRWLLDVVFVWACVVPGLLNYLWPLWDARNQTWCDKIAKSVVVRA